MTFGSKTSLVVSPTESMRSSRFGSIRSTAKSTAASLASIDIAPGLAAMAEKRRQEEAAKKKKEAEEEAKVQSILAKDRAEREEFEKKQAAIIQKAAEDESRKQLMAAAKAIQQEDEQRAAAERAVTAAVERETEAREEPDIGEVPLVINLDPVEQDEPVVVTVK